MRVFITGASGYIGNAVAKAFVRAGHRVAGLIRSEKSAKALRAAEIEPIIGDMGQPESYKAAAEHAEVLIQCASDMSAERVKRDADTIATFQQIAQKSSLPRIFLYTSGCFVYGSRPEIVDEASPLNPLDIVLWRPGHEEKVLAAASKNLRCVIFRPGFVYGGAGGYCDPWFASAQKGQIEIAGNGENYRTMIHRDDLGEAYVLAAEKELSNVILNLSDGTYHKVKEMAEAVAAAAGIPKKIKYIPDAEALAQFGPTVT